MAATTPAKPTTGSNTSCGPPALTPCANIVKCKKCGIDISETQTECPSCGSKDPHS